jgi:hypothetical protein
VKKALREVAASSIAPKTAPVASSIAPKTAARLPPPPSTVAGPISLTVSELHARGLPNTDPYVVFHLGDSELLHTELLHTELLHTEDLRNALDGHVELVRWPNAYTAHVASWPLSAQGELDLGEISVTVYDQESVNGESVNGTDATSVVLGRGRFMIPRVAGAVLGASRLVHQINLPLSGVPRGAVASLSLTLSMTLPPSMAPAAVAALPTAPKLAALTTSLATTEAKTVAAAVEAAPPFTAEEAAAVGCEDSLGSSGVNSSGVAMGRSPPALPPVLPPALPPSLPPVLPPVLPPALPPSLPSVLPSPLTLPAIGNPYAPKPLLFTPGTTPSLARTDFGRDGSAYSPRASSHFVDASWRASSHSVDASWRAPAGSQPMIVLCDSRGATGGGAGGGGAGDGAVWLVLEMEADATTEESPRESSILGNWTSAAEPSELQAPRTAPGVPSPRTAPALPSFEALPHHVVIAPSSSRHVAIGASTVEQIHRLYGRSVQSLPQRRIPVTKHGRVPGSEVAMHPHGAMQHSFRATEPRHVAAVRAQRLWRLTECWQLNDFGGEAPNGWVAVALDNGAYGFVPEAYVEWFAQSKDGMVEVPRPERAVNGTCESHTHSQVPRPERALEETLAPLASLATPVDASPAPATSSSSAVSSSSLDGAPASAALGGTEAAEEAVAEAAAEAAAAAAAAAAAEAAAEAAAAHPAPAWHLIFGHGPLGLGLSAVPNSAPSKAVPHTAPHTGGTFTGGTFVSEVLEGSAAMAQGVVVGCLVLAVNGHDVRGDPPHEVQALIGQAVRPLTLTLSSPILSKTNPADAATAATAAATAATAATTATAATAAGSRFSGRFPVRIF